MKQQELSSILTMVRVLYNYDDYLYSTYRESLYDNLSQKFDLAAGLNAGLSILSLHYSHLTWDKFYDKVDVKASFAKYDSFIPDQIYNLVMYKNEDLTLSEVEALFTQANTLLKGKSNDKARKTRTKRIK